MMMGYFYKTPKSGICPHSLKNNRDVWHTNNWKRKTFLSRCALCCHTMYFNFEVSAIIIAAALLPQCTWPEVTSSIIRQTAVSSPLVSAGTDCASGCYSKSLSGSRRRAPGPPPPSWAGSDHTCCWSSRLTEPEGGQSCHHTDCKCWVACRRTREEAAASPAHKRSRWGCHRVGEAGLSPSLRRWRYPPPSSGRPSPAGRYRPSWSALQTSWLAPGTEWQPGCTGRHPAEKPGNKSLTWLFKSVEHNWARAAYV